MKKAGKLTTAEEKEEIEVTRETYERVYKMVGGHKTVIIMTLWILATQKLSWMNDFMKKDWAARDSQDQQDNYSYYVT